MSWLRYWLGPASVMMIGIAGFVFDYPWLGASTFLMMMVADVLLPADTAEHPIQYPVLMKIPMYLHLLVFLPALILSFAAYAQSSAIAGTLGLIEAASALLSLGWLFTVPTVAVVHELYHGTSRVGRWLSTAGSVVLGNPHRMLTHVHMHHLHVGTPLDPDTPRRGELVHTFVVRAMLRNWKALYDLDRRRMAGSAWPAAFLGSRTVHSVALVIASILAMAFAAGPEAGLVFAGALAFTMLYVETLNYVQHYGLIRVAGEPVAERHAWNHLSPVVRAVGFDVTNHSPHHVLAPEAVFCEHCISSDQPQMPNALLCVTLALLAPPLWERYIVRPRLKDWDMRFASPEERVLAAEANRAAGWPEWQEPMNELRVRAAA